MGNTIRADFSAIQINSVLRNTFLLLGMTLAFSAGTATLAIAINAALMNVWMMLGVYIALLVAVSKTEESSWGLFWTFALTGFLGYTAGPIVGYYISAGMGDIVGLALGCTATIFVGLAGYATVSKRDFSFMGGFLAVGILTAFVLGLAAYIFQLPALSLAVSGAFVLLSSGIILWQVSRIVNGGETNYIRATVTLYVSIYNIFMSLLRIFGVMND